MVKCKQVQFGAATWKNIHCQERERIGYLEQNHLILIWKASMRGRSFRLLHLDRKRQYVYIPQDLKEKKHHLQVSKIKKKKGKKTDTPKTNNKKCNAICPSHIIVRFL